VATRVKAVILCLMTTDTVTAQTTGAWVPTDHSFAARLALVRHRMGWNIKEAARECGQPAATWRLWEVEGTTPRDQVKLGRIIATRTGCDYLWLVHGPDRGGDALTGWYPTDPLALRLLATIGVPAPRRPTGRTTRTHPTPMVGRPLTPAGV